MIASYKSNLTASRPCRAPHHVIHLIWQTPPYSKWRTSQPYGARTRTTMLKQVITQYNDLALF